MHLQVSWNMHQLSPAYAARSYPTPRFSERFDLAQKEV